MTRVVLFTIKFAEHEKINICFSLSPLRPLLCWLPIILSVILMLKNTVFVFYTTRSLNTSQVFLHLLFNQRNTGRANSSNRGLIEWQYCIVLDEWFRRFWITLCIFSPYLSLVVNPSLRIPLVYWNFLSILK